MSHTRPASHWQILVKDSIGEPHPPAKMFASGLMPTVLHKEPAEEGVYAVSEFQMRQKVTQIK